VLKDEKLQGSLLCEQVYYSHAALYHLFVAGSLAVDSLIPDLHSEPGKVSPEVGLLIMGALNAMPKTLATSWLIR
jgi:hypothetical protein